MKKTEENYDKFEEGLKEYHKRLKKYTYRDNSAGAKVVFECEAIDILEADKLYQKEIGKDPRKQSYIGCSIEELPYKKLSVIYESDIKRFIEHRNINQEDIGLIEELSKFNKNLFIGTLHNMFAYQGRNSRQTLKGIIEQTQNEEERRLCELSLKFFEKYGWAASVNMVGVLEDRKS